MKDNTGVLLYYDLANFDYTLLGISPNDLGFSQIFRAGVDIKVLDAASNNEDYSGSVVYNSNTSKLMSRMREGAKGVLLTDYVLDKKFIQFLSQNKNFLLLPINKLISDSGFSRQRDLLFMRKLIRYLESSRVEFSIITFTDDPAHQYSRMQLLYISQLVFANPEHAKAHVTNLKSIIGDE